MRRITLLRHAKSSWKDTSLGDFARPLNKRGKEDAPMMGKRLSRRGLLPDLIVSSPARRAIATAKMVAEQVGYPAGRIEESGEIYEAGVPALLGIIRSQAEAVRHLMLVGHNPGFTDTANFLLGVHFVANIPTCGVVCMDLAVETWSEAGKGTARIVFYDYPKKRD